MPAVDLLRADNFSTLVLKRPLQECNLAVPQSGCHPEIGLLVEERDVADLLGAQVYHVLKGLVVDYTA